MAWHVDITWHNISGLILSFTLPGHYWITLTIHVFKLALGKGITAPFIAAPARHVLHGLLCDIVPLTLTLSWFPRCHDAETA